MSDELEKDLPRINFYGVEFDEVVTAKPGFESQQTQPALVELRSALSRIHSNPTLLLDMPRLDETNTDQEAVDSWLKKVGISSLNQELEISEVEAIINIAPEIKKELAERGSVNVKDFLEATRYEFAKRILGQRKIREGNELINKYISPDLMLDGPARVAVTYNFYPDDMQGAAEFEDVFNAGYRSKIDGTHIFSIDLEADTKNVYLDPFKTFDEEVEIELAWTMAHEITHAWVANYYPYFKDGKQPISQEELNNEPLEDTAEKVAEINHDEGSELLELAHTLNEGFAVFVETKVADGTIADTKDQNLKQKLIKERKDIYFRHRVSKRLSPYYEGFYQVVRKIRQKAKTTEEMIKIFSQIDYVKCSQIEIEGEEGTFYKDGDYTEGYKYVMDPLTIPLKTSKDNNHQTIGEYLEQTAKSS